MLPMIPAGTERVLSATWSVCPRCLARIPASRVARGDEVYLRKVCPEHGPFEVVIWRGVPDYTSWTENGSDSAAVLPNTEGDEGCPFDCGHCTAHGRPTCCALVEVTARCDLGCRFCFADAGRGRAADPPIEALGVRFRKLLSGRQLCNLQLSGGEPTLRDDLPDVIALARSMGFQFIQLNSNGRRLARDPGYAAGLKEAGLSCVFLQFDGTDDEIYRNIRGRALLSEKLAAIRICGELNLGVVLVPTLVPGVNTHDVGALVRFGLANAPAVRGVHFQPVSYFGRYPKPPADGDRITVPEVIRAIAEQTGGLIRQESFKPGESENPYCSFHGNFLPMPDGDLISLTRHESRSCCQPGPDPAGAARDFVARQWSSPRIETAGTSSDRPDRDSWSALLNGLRTRTFTVSGMAFQDAWNLDLERLRDCHVHVAASDGRVIPFCAYNLTDVYGRGLYRSEIA